MNWKVLKTEEDYKAAVKRTMEIFYAQEGGEEEELDLLLVLVKDYEDKNIHLPQLSTTELHRIKIRELHAKGRQVAYTFYPSKSAGAFLFRQKRNYTNLSPAKKNDVASARRFSFTRNKK